MGKYTAQFFQKGIFILTFSIVSIVSAQEGYDITFEDASFKIGIHGSPNGYGIFYRNTTPVRNQFSRVFDINFTGIRHVKEKSILNQRMVNTSPYIYGKTNRLYVLRPSVGIQKMLAEKPNRNSIGVNCFAVMGPILGFLKPIFIDIEEFDPNNPAISNTVSVRYNPEIHQPFLVSRYSSFGKGIGSTKFVTGISFKTGVEFNWGYYSSDLKSLEIGVLIDYLPSRPELMHFIKNKSVYSSFYLSIALGKNY